MLTIKDGLGVMQPATPAQIAAIQAELGIVSGGGGGIATGSGSDMTAATVGAYGVETYTAGAQFVILRSGAVVTREHLSGASDLGADLVHVGGGIYIINSADTDAVVNVSGAMQMTLAQRTAWTALSPTIKKGFLVFVTDVGHIITTAGVTHVPGGLSMWVPGLGWQWVGNLRYDTYQAGTAINVGSGALAISQTVVVPANVMGSYDRLRCGFFWDMTAGAAAKTLAIFVNGTAIYNPGAAITAGHLQFSMIKSLYGNGPSSQFHSIAGLPGDAVGGANSNYPTRSIDLTTTDLTVTSRATCPDGTATCKYLSVMVSSNMEL